MQGRFSGEPCAWRPYRLLQHPARISGQREQAVFGLLSLLFDSTPVTMGKREGKVTALFGGAHHDVDFVAVFYAGGILGHLVVDDDSHSAGGGNVGRVELGGQQHVGQRGLRLG